MTISVQAITLQSVAIGDIVSASRQGFSVVVGVPVDGTMLSVEMTMIDMSSRTG